MKIVNKEVFLNMPSGTLYSEFIPDDSFSGFNIKYDTIYRGDNKDYPIDWYYMELSDFDDCDDSNGRYKRIDNMINYGAEYPLLLDASSRDGMYEDNQMFAVYDKYDIIRLIDVLKGLISEESKDK